MADPQDHHIPRSWQLFKEENSPKHRVNTSLAQNTLERYFFFKDEKKEDMTHLTDRQYSNNALMFSCYVCKIM